MSTKTVQQQQVKRKRDAAADVGGRESSRLLRPNVGADLAVPSSSSSFMAEARGGGGVGGGERRGPVAVDGLGDVDLSLLEALEREQGAAAAAAGGGGAAAAAEALDLRGLRRMVLAFEKKLKENLEARLKYADQPERFMETEVDLDTEVRKLHALAGAPHLYPDLVRLGAVPSLLSLLSHENSDIATAAVGLLCELTDADAVGESGEEARALVEAIVEGNGLELLGQNLARMDERDETEAGAVFNTLGILENMVEVWPEVAGMVGERTKMLRWLLTRVKVREFDSNRQYASEVLAILLQAGGAGGGAAAAAAGAAANQRRVGQMNGVDTLLQAVAQYKSREPRTAEEEELVENLFDALCSVVMADENKERFVKAEGVELMIILLKAKKPATFGSAMKVLDFAMTRCVAACERFVDVLGLKTLFAAFMGKIPVKKKSKVEMLQLRQELEERVVSLLASLSLGLTKGTRKDRLLSKFVEKEYEKIDRLLELYMRYWERVKAEEKRQEEHDRALQGKNNDDDDDDDALRMSEEDKYLARLDAGLYTLQLVALILAHLWASQHTGIQDRVELLLKQQHLTRRHLTAVLQEYRDNIGDVDGVEEKQRRQAQVDALIEAL